MIDSSIVPPKGSLRYRFTKWFCDHVNFCFGYKYGEFDEHGEPVYKPDNKVYNFFYTYWLWPFIQTGCICCNTVRGLLYGAIIGFIIGVLI